MVYKHTNNTKMNKHFHTKHGKNTHTRPCAHTCTHTGSRAHNANKSTCRNAHSNTHMTETGAETPGWPGEAMDHWMGGNSKAALVNQGPLDGWKLQD